MHTYNLNNLISVIIPCFNAERNVQAAIESVLSQTYSNFEIIVIDDGSTDNTIKAVAPYLDRITFLNKKNGGPASARNLGISKANGDLIAFLDSDDYWLPTKLEKIQNIFQKDSHIDMVHHAVYEISPKGSKSIRRFMPLSGDPYRFLLLRGNQLFTSATTLRKKALTDKNGFSEYIDFIGAEDYELWLRLAKSNASFYYLDEVLGEYRKTKNSITANLEKYAPNLLNVYSHHLKQLYESGRVSTYEYENYLFYHKQIKEYKITKHLFTKGDYLSTIKHLAVNIKNAPMKLHRFMFVFINLFRNRIIKFYINRVKTNTFI